MNRREFLKGSLLAGLGTLSGRLIAAAAEVAKTPFEDELIARYLKTAKLKLTVGAGVPFRALHVSDTHLSFDDAGDLLRGDAAVLKLYEARQPRFPKCVQSLAATVAYAKREKIPLLHTGDLIDHFSEANLACVKNAFAGADCLAAFGNHEVYGHHTDIYSPKSREAARATCRRFEEVWPNPALVASRLVNGVNFVAFDNGGLERWFAREIEEGLEKALSADAPAVLMCHKPFCTPTLYEFERAHNAAKRKNPNWSFGRGLGAYMTFDEAVGESRPSEHMRQVGRIVRAHAKTNLKAILCGHLHYEWQGSFAGIPQIVVGGNYEGKAYEISFE